jgi:hypothetical protein
MLWDHGLTPKEFRISKPRLCAIFARFNRIDPAKDRAKSALVEGYDRFKRHATACPH